MIVGFSKLHFLKMPTLIKNISFSVSFRCCSLFRSFTQRFAQHSTIGNVCVCAGRTYIHIWLALLCAMYIQNSTYTRHVWMCMLYTFGGFRPILSGPSVFIYLFIYFGSPFPFSWQWQKMGILTSSPLLMTISWIHTNTFIRTYMAIKWCTHMHEMWKCIVI